MHELKHTFLSSDFAIAIVSEPYTGASLTVSNIPGVDVFQFETTSFSTSSSTSSEKRKVKACILVKPELVSAFGCSQFSSPNNAVIQIVLNNRKTYIASTYIEPREDAFNTINVLHTFLSLTEGSQIVLCGDFNGHHPLWGSEDVNDRGEDVIGLASLFDLTV